MKTCESLKIKGCAGRAFTLIELLVVVAIMALLMSILLPSLAGAKRAAQRVACLVGPKDIATGSAMNATENNGWPIGAPGGSGLYLAGKTFAYGPAVQRWDFLGPLARMWKMGMREGDGTPAGAANYFDDIRNNKKFLCPSNKFLATKFRGPAQATAGPMISYNTCRIQLMSDSSGAGDGLEKYGDVFEEKLPDNWKPSMDKIGSPANKIIVGDGARYSTSSQAPDFDLAVEATWGGAFSDSGVYSTFTRSWDRSRAPGNGNNSGVDARIYGFRHSPTDPPPGAPANAFRGNFGFYDGHAATLGDLEASNPQLWLPAGTTLTDLSAVWPDAVRQFGLDKISLPITIGS